MFGAGFAPARRRGSLRSRRGRAEAQARGRSASTCGGQGSWPTLEQDEFRPAHSGMAGASIEATLELWASSLRDVKARLRFLFTQERLPRQRGFFLTACWAMSVARRAGLPSRGGGRSRSMAAAGHSGAGPVDADDLRDIVRDYALEALADDDAVLVIDHRVPEAGQGFLRRRPAIYRVGGQDHQLPDRGVRLLCVAPRARLY